MKSLLKLAGISAVLSAGLVTAFDSGPAVSQGTVKIHHERVAAEPAAPVEAVVLVEASAGMVRTVASDASAGAADCRAQPWPYVSVDCVSAAGRDAGRKPVRTITIERRDAPNTSTLVRVPVAGN